MKLTVNITKGDYKAFRRFARYRVQQVHWLYIALLLFLEISLWRGHEPETELAVRIVMAIMILLIFMGFALGANLLLLVLRKLRGITFQDQYGPHEFEIADGKLIETNDSGRTESQLSQIKKVCETPRHIFVLKKNGIAHIIPKRELSADQPAAAVLAALNGETPPPGSDDE